MAKQSPGKRLIAAILALVLVLGVCPTWTFAAEADTDAREDQGVRLPNSKVDDVDSDNLQDAAKVTHE